MSKRIINIGTFDESLSFQRQDTNDVWSMSGNYFHKHKSDRINIQPYQRFLSERNDWFYYIAYSDLPGLCENFNVEALIPEPVLNSIRTGKCTLIFHYSAEGDMKDMSIKIFHDFIERITSEYNIPWEKIRWMHENYDADKVCQNWLTKNNRRGVKISKYYTFGGNVLIDHESLYAHDVNKSRFIYLNRGGRSARAYLNIWLWKHNIDVTMSCGSENTQNLISYGVETYDRHNTIDKNDIEEFVKLLPLSIDDIDLDTQNAQAVSNIGNTKFLLSMERAGIYIVGETLYEEPGRFMTEKIVKALLAQKPFIVLSTPRFLEMLRDCGYKTFGSFIDESYDTLTDNVDRLQAVCTEIQRLNDMDQDSFDSMLSGMKKIAEYNFNHYKSLPNPDVFLDNLF